MNASNILARFLNVLFGLCALVVAFLAFMSFLLFDNPAASRSILTWNFAASLFVYLFVYKLSISKCSDARRDSAPDGTLLRWALLPLGGIVWILVAYLMLELVCHGKFSCR